MAKLMIHQWIKQFNKIYIVCPTYAEDEVWSGLDEHVNSGLITVLDNINENTLRRVWNGARELKRNGETCHILIYFDDCGGQDGFRSLNEGGVLNQLSTKGNHSNISSIFVVQRLVFCSPTMRVNAQYILAFYTQQEDERKRLYKEYGIGTFKNFNMMLDLSTREKYHTLFIDRRGPGEPKYYHNFKLITNPSHIMA